MLMYDDKAAQARSIMHAQKRLCNGEANGWQCHHYFECVVPMDVPNSDHLKQGERFRFCTLLQLGASPMDLGDGGKEMPVHCNRYEESQRPYSNLIEEYNPLTPEEIADIAGDPPPDPNSRDLTSEELAALDAGVLDVTTLTTDAPTNATAGEDNG